MRDWPLSRLLRMCCGHPFVSPKSPRLSCLSRHGSNAVGACSDSSAAARLPD